MILTISNSEYKIISDGYVIIEKSGFTDGEALLLIKEIQNAGDFYGESEFKLDELGIIAQKILKKIEIDWNTNFISYKE